MLAGQVRTSPLRARAADYLDRFGIRTSLELEVGHRQLLVQSGIPVYLTLGLGVAFGLDASAGTRVQLAAENPGACAAATGALCVTRQSDVALWLRPSVSFGLQIGRGLALTYLFQLDPGLLERSTHTLSLGFSF